MTDLAAASPAVQRVTQEQLDYLGEVIRLRLVQEMNLRDTELAYDAATGKNTDQQITYVADSSLFYFYINTFARREYIKAEALPRVAELSRERLEGKDRDAAIRKVISMAVITAEYLFSGMLPGQRGFPLYIAHEHAEEFQHRISSILDDIKKAALGLTEKRKAELARRVGTLGRRLNALRSVDVSADDAAFEGLRRILDVELPALVSEFDLAEVDQAVNLLHLMENDVARPLRLAPGVNRDLLNNAPDSDIVEEWAQRLRNFQYNELYQKNDARHRLSRPDNLATDARVLARLQAINEDCRNRKLSNRFVLITTSQAMLSADVHWLQEHDLPLEHALVRPLTQFVPILNFRDMPNFIERRNAFSQLRSAMDGLFQWKRKFKDMGWVRFLRDLDIHLRGLNREKSGIDTALNQKRMSETLGEELIALRQERMDRVFRRVDLQRFQDSILNIGELWQGMADNSIGLNAHLLVHHYSRHLGKIAVGLDSLTANRDLAGRLSDDYEARQFNLTDRLARIHLRMATRIMMANPRSMTWRSAEVLRGARPSQYLDAPDNEALFKVIDQIIDQDIVAAENTLLELTHRDHLEVSVLNLIVATVALRIGLWDNAANFGRQAQILAQGKLATGSVAGDSHLQARQIAAEAQWLAGCARRVGAAHDIADKAHWQTAAEYGLSQSHRIQSAAKAYFSELGDFLGQARSQAEITMIEVNQLLVRFITDVPVDAGQLHQVWTMAEEAHLLTTGLISEMDEDDGDQIVALRVRLMAEIAKIQLALVATLSGTPLPPGKRESLPEMLRSADRDMGRVGRETFSSWPLIADILRFAAGVSGNLTLRALTTSQDDLLQARALRSTTATDLEVMFTNRAFEILSAKES